MHTFRRCGAGRSARPAVAGLRKAFKKNILALMEKKKVLALRKVKKRTAQRVEPFVFQ